METSNHCIQLQINLELVHINTKIPKIDPHNENSHSVLNNKYLFSVNKPDSLILGTENPFEIHEIAIIDLKLTVWTGVCAKPFLGHIFSSTMT